MSHPLNQSQLYKLKSRQKLASLLRSSLNIIEQLAKNGSKEYKEFEKQVGKKDRHIECPKGKLYAIASRLNDLLGRIQVPEYVHSGIKGRSYVTNAKAHLTDVPLIKEDIKSFFPLSSYKFVFACFIQAFQCSPDVASILTRLSTINGHIPTGSPSSTIVSYYAYKPMFDEIYDLALSENLTMTLIVDDLTFSGAKASSGFLLKVRNIVKRFGLRVHKRHVYSARDTKIVTGVALTKNGFKLPNKRRKKLHDSLRTFHNAKDDESRKQAARVALGRTGEAAQLEPDCFGPLFDKIKPQLIKAIYPKKHV